MRYRKLKAGYRYSSIALALSKSVERPLAQFTLPLSIFLALAIFAKEEQ